MQTAAATTPPTIAPRRPRPPFVALESAFLRRSAVASLVTSLVVASTAAVYFDPAWGWQYLLTALWALVFFSLTPLILKTLLFEERRMLGLALVVGKLVWMALIFWVMSGWSAATESRGTVVASLLAGILTPLAVVSLRLVGRVMVQSRTDSTGAEATR
jgi:hypothetical protein